MIGIASVGGYVPRYRLSGKTLASVWGAGGGAGERAVPNYDEDSLTMAAEASLKVLHGRDPGAIGDCFLASTTPPYLEKSTATILAAVADLRPDVLTADLIATCEGGYATSREFIDVWRLPGDRYLNVPPAPAPR
jgi:3-hydroxy-3-methylglutaryl CoA synthase